MRVLMSSLLVALATMVGAALAPVSAASPMTAVSQDARVATPVVEKAHWRRRHWRRHYYYRPYYYRPYRYHYYRPYRHYGYHGFPFRFHFRRHHRRHHYW